MSAPTFSREDIANWNKTAAVLYLPKRLVGKSKVAQIRTGLIKAIGEHKLSAVQALSGEKYRVEFKSASLRSACDITGVAFRGVTVTPYPAYEEVKSVFLDRAPLPLPDQLIIDALFSYGPVITVKHLTVKGYPNIKSGTRMVSMVVNTSIPADIKIAGFPILVRYRGQPPVCFACRTVGHLVKDCPKSRRN